MCFLSCYHKVSLKYRRGTLVKFGGVNYLLKERSGYPQVSTKFTLGGTSV